MSQETESPTFPPDTLLSGGALADLWSGASGAAAAAELPLDLLAEVTRSPDPQAGWLQKILARIQKVTGAERIFYLDVKGPIAHDPGAAPPVELGACLASLDFDREPISKPESKVPLSLLGRVLEDGKPLWAPNSLQEGSGSEAADEAASRTRGFIAVPLSAHGLCHGIIYLEHRFQPIRLTSPDGEKLIFLLRLLGLRGALEKLLAANGTLWRDLLSVRERRSASPSAPSEPPRAMAPAGTIAAEPAGFQGNYSAIISRSPSMMEIFKLLDRIRSSSAPVLINGESGTGKELIARAIHQNSPRRDQNFVSENCGALTETLLESELFGYVKGAFTGANRDHMGLFELAHRGTLLLDEVGDMSSAMQKKLLRALQEGVIRRVGGKEYIPVDARIISATNKDLLEEVRRGNFREDLYYRLNVINIKLPPLRERREDIPELVKHFLEEIGREAGLQKLIDPRALQLLGQYAWPGNVRELQNEVKRLYALSESRIEPGNLSEPIRKGERGLIGSSRETDLAGMPLKDAIERVEKDLITRALIEAQGNKSQVAKQLKIPKTSLYNKITKYQIESLVEDALS